MRRIAPERYARTADVWNDKPVVAVFGSSKAIEGDELYGQARVLGRLLAREGFVVCNGGYGGVMEASARGASEMGGFTIGLTTTVFEDGDANPYIARQITNTTLFERLANFVNLAEAFVALKGGVGTLAEFSVIWNLMQTRALGPRPFILLGDHWRDVIETLRRQMVVREKDARLFRMVSSPEQTLEVLKKYLPIKP
ncbi:MAG: LOG family protein [Candidatus Abyssubacteria bacterium]